MNILTMWQLGLEVTERAMMIWWHDNSCPCRIPFWSSVIGHLHVRVKLATVTGRTGRQAGRQPGEEWSGGHRSGAEHHERTQSDRPAKVNMQWEPGIRQRTLVNDSTLQWAVYIFLHTKLLRYCYWLAILIDLLETMTRPTGKQDM